MLFKPFFQRCLLLCCLLPCWVSAQLNDDLLNPRSKSAPRTESYSSEPALGGTGLQPPRAFEFQAPESPVLTLDLTHKANDVWDRIRRGFGMTNLDTETVQLQLDSYLRHPESLQRIFERGRPYLYYILDQLEERGMPTELALLPMVESAYNPRAYSRAQASGLWQFIPSTGRNYNLTQNAWIDERRDIIASTNAALDYLQTIYDMHGDWHLALASYNWGEGAVKRAVEKNRAAGLPTDYSALTMPGETRNYVPRLQALKNIVQDPERFGIELPAVDNDRYFVTVDGPVGVDLKSLAQMADMTQEAFLSLNPGYKRSILPSGRATLVLPEDKADAFVARMASQGQQLKRWRVYELGRRESLASVAQRFGIDLEELQQINGVSARSKLGRGFPLLVPTSSSAPEGLSLSLPTPPLPEPAPIKKFSREKPAATKASLKNKKGKGRRARDDDDEDDDDDPPVKKTKGKNKAKPTKGGKRAQADDDEDVPRSKAGKNKAKAAAQPARTSRTTPHRDTTPAPKKGGHEKAAKPAAQPAKGRHHK